MYSHRILLAAATLSAPAVFQARAQTVTEVSVIKASEWLQTSAADPVIVPRNPGPGFGGPYGFWVRVGGTGLAGITAPSITLPAGSTFSSGPLGYNPDDEAWGYGASGNNYGGPTEAGRDAAFAFGTYGLNVLGEAISLNFPATLYPPNTPKVTLTGGTWSGGKYLIDATRPLTITTNEFTHFDKNADGAMQLFIVNDQDDLILPDMPVFHSDNPGGPNVRTATIPANTLVAGKDYVIIAAFYAIMDKRFETRFEAAAYQRNTGFTISVTAPPIPGALATLHGVGDLVEGTTFSEVRAATKSGGVIYAVGDSNSYGIGTAAETAFLWTSTNGIRPLPDIVLNLSGSSYSSTNAVDITPDGAFIASRARFGPGGNTRHAVRVTTSGLTNLDLGVLAPFTFSQTSGISSNGSVLYGVANYTSLSSVPVRNRAVRFTAGSTIPTVIPFLNVGDDNSTPADRGVSADGSVMVGRSTNGTVDASPASPGGNGIGLGSQAFRYVHGAGVSGIPFISGGTWSGAVAVSPDGNLTLVRGNSTSAPLGEFYLHNATTGTLTSYGTPNGSRRPGGIVGMTADGSIVATSFNAADNPTNQTVIRNTYGWHDFQTIVENAGVDLTGWNLRTETLFGISSDGTLVWGRGVHDGNREGFVVEFPAGYLAAYTEPAIYSTPNAAIVGAWALGDQSLSTTRGALIFFANGYYMHIQLNDVGDNTGADGFERGQYTWDANTGAFTISPLVDTNGDIGFSGGVDGEILTISGDTLTLSGAEGSFSLTRIKDPANPIVGAWGDATNSDNSVSAVFLPSGYYFMAQDGDSTPAGDPTGHDGMEWGTYTWNSTTGALTAAPIVDTNGEWGLSHPQGAQTLTLSDQLLTLTLTDASGSYSLGRVGPATVVGTVAGGTNQTITLGSAGENVGLTFSSVSGGDVTVSTTTSGPPPPAGFIASTGSGPSVYYDISTTATFSGQVEIVIHYDPASFVDLAGLRLFHFEGGAWTDITTWHNIANSKLYGLTSSFSPFTIFEPSLMVRFTGPPQGTFTPVNTNVTLSASAEGHVPGRTYNVIWRLERSGAPALVFPHVATSADLSSVIQVPEAGVYSITLSVTSDDGLTANPTLVEPDLLPASLIVYAPNGGFVTGGGSIYSPPGAYVALPDAEGLATFGFVSKYQKGANKPTGNTQFDFHTGGLRFKSTAYDWLVIAGSKAQYKGVGTINGGGDYAFMITADDSPSGDRFRIKITDRLTDTLIYDNQRGAADSDELHAGPLLRAGSIVIHK